MSRRPKGGMGRKKVAKQEPLVSEAWGTLATTTISMLETVGSINEDANEDCIEEAAQLSEMNKKRMSFEDRLQLLDCVNQMVEGFLGAFGDLSAEDIEEHGVAEMYENFYGSIFTLVTESVEGINKDGAAPEQKEQLQQQLCMLLRLIDTVMAVSFDNHAVSALEYFRPFAGTLFELCCAQLCLGAQYDFFVRSMASSLLTDQIEGKYLNSFLADPANRSVVELIIDTCFKLCAKEDKKGEDTEKEDEEEDEENPMGEQEGDSSQNLGTQLLDTLTSSLTNDAGESIVAPMILDRSQTILNKADAPALETKSALICLAVVPEAAQKYARESAYLGAVLPLLFKFADAPHEEIVRGGAYIALAEHFEHLQPEIRGHQAQLLAAITAALQDPVEKTSRDTKAKACLPLHILVKKSETLPAEYLDASSPKNLMRFLLDQVKPFASKSAEEMTEADTDLLSELIMAVRDFAESYEVATREGKLGAAGDYFAPFVTEAFDLMLTLAQRSTHVVVKGQAASSSAIIAANMAEDTLLEKMPTLSTLLQSSMEDPELGEDEELADELYTVRQSMHATWSALARKLQGKIEPYVETHVPFICRALAAGYGDEDEEEEQEDEDGMPQPPSENQARDGERSYALECYRDFAAALGAKFLPFQDRCFTVLTENYTTYSSEVQASVIELAKELPQKLYPIETKPTAGVDLVLDAKHAELLKACKAIIVDYIQHATDPEVVEYALDFLAELLDVYGQIVVNDDAKTMEAIEKATKSLLKKDAPCQTVDPREIAYIDTENGFGAGGFGGFGGFGEDGEDGEDAEDDEEEEEEEEEEQDAKCEKAECTDASCTDGSCHPKDEQAQDLALMESLFNTLGALAKAKGASFKSTLDAAWPRIVKLRKQKAYAGAISGFFADLGEALGEELFAEYRAQVLPLLLADINNAKTTPGVVRNSGFAVGQIFLKSSVESTKEFYDQAVSGLMNGLKIVQAAIDSATDKESSQYADFLGAKDNVIAAMARLLSVGGEHLAQRGEMVPLVVQGLPLANDFGENLPTYTAVEKILATTPNEILQPLYPQLLRTLATVVAKQGTEQGVTEEVAATIVRAARTILAAQPNLRAEVVDALEPEVKQAFTAKIDA